MAFKKPLLLASVLVLLAGILTIVFAAQGIRWWVWWKAREQNLTVKIDKVDAPFLGPVVLHNVRIGSAPDSDFRIEVDARRVVLGLNLKAALLRLRGREIENFSAEDVEIEIRRNRRGARAIPQNGWSTLQKLLPTRLNLDRANLRVENGSTVVSLRNVSLVASEIESGRFTAAEARIASPWLRQTFSNLRGATNWQGDRLTIAGLILTRGLDLQSLTSDLSHLNKQHLGLEFDLDAFGGKIRTSLTTEWRSHHSNWNAAGSANDLSLARTSEAIGFADRVDGLLHACKFTFRGSPADPTHATASIWTELTGLKWRGRSADTIMVGAALYNRQIQLQQVYVQQKNNQLTLSGEGTLPSNGKEWFNPDFRGDISASIHDLGQFAELFGGTPGDFAGEVAIEGTMNAGDRKIGGHLTASGKSLSIFKSPIDSFETKLNLKATQLEIEQLEMRREKDFVHATGTVDLAHGHDYSAKSTFSVGNMANYPEFIPAAWNIPVRQGAISCEWSGTGKAQAHSGNFQINGHGLRLAGAGPPPPFDAQLDGVYAPGSLFFRQLHLTNEHVSVNGFLTVASKYVQLQALALDLDGKPRVRGNFFLPLVVEKIKSGPDIPGAFDSNQQFDLDLAVDTLDLAQLSRALTGRALLNGTLSTRFSIFGGLDALQGWGETHLHDFAWENDPARASLDCETRLTAGTMTTMAKVQLRNSEPITTDLNAHISLGKENRDAMDAISATVDFPKVAAAQLPRFLARELFRDGIVSGKLSVSETWRHPKISGAMQLSKAKLNSARLHATDLSARLNFEGTKASIESATLGAREVEVALQGEIDFSDLHKPAVRLAGVQPFYDLTPAGEAGCLGDITLVSMAGRKPATPPLDHITWASNLDGNYSTVSLASPLSGAASGTAINAFLVCPGNEKPRAGVVLGCEPPAKAAAPRKRKHR